MGKNGNVLRVACLGAGYFAQFHYQAWKKTARVRLVGACDRDRERALATGVTAFDELDQMLRDAQPDLLDIITPPPTHLEALKCAIAKGVKTVICQKPFCESLAQATEATALAQAAGVTVVIHENFRFQPWYRTIRQALDDRLLGDLMQLTFRLRTGDGQGPSAYLDRQPYFQTMPKLLVHETGVHWIDTFRFLLGEPLAVYADLRRLNPVIKGEDAGYFIFDYPNGLRALFDGNRLLDHAAENCRTTLGEALVEGTGGSLTLSGDGSVKMRRFGEQQEEVLLAARNWDGFGGDCVRNLIQHVVNGVLDGQPLENEASDYLKVIEIEQAIYESDRLDGSSGSLHVLEAPKPKTITTQAMEKIRQLIFDGELAAGSDHLESELADRLGMSRTPVREATLMLAQQGLLEVRPRKGVRISTLSLKDMAEIYSVLTELESLAAEEAAKIGYSDADLAALKQSIESMEQALEREDREAWAVADDAFHDELVRLGGNSRVESIVSMMANQVRRARAMTLYIRPLPVKSNEDHRAVFSAIKAGDATSARDRHRSHRQHAREVLIELLKKHRLFQI